jgi:hypothetical protein
MIKLHHIINKSIYGTVGYISSKNDLNTLEQYILYNLPILKQFTNVITSTTYISENNLYLHKKLIKLWKNYFPNSIHINTGKSRGHNFGTSDNDNSLFDYCKKNNIEWLCKSANDVIFQESILDKEIKEADFYYMNGIGYGGMNQYNFDFDRIINEDFYPQTNFYFINVSKTDYLNDKKHVDEIYNKVQNIPEYNGKAWEYGFRSCETLLAECINRNNLLKHHLVSKEKYLYLLNIVKNYNIHDCSHKNIMIEGICHYQNNNQQIIEI